MYLTQGLHRSVQTCSGTPMTVHGERTRTAGEVLQRVSRLGGALRGLGVRTGDRVAVLAHNCDHYTEFVLGIAWADAIFNLINTRWSIDEVAFCLRDSGATVLIVDDEFAPMVPALTAADPGLRSVIHTGDGAAPAGAAGYEDLLSSAAEIDDPRRDGDEIAGLFYTGGTTGFPKGVALTHDNIVSSCLGALSTYPVVVARGTHLHVAPMFHLAAFTSWGMQLLVGGTHVSLSRFDVPAMLRQIEKTRVTSTTLVPAMIQMLVEHPDTANRDLSSLRSILYGGSPIAETVLRKAMEVLPNAGFVQCYGMTEVSGVGTILTPEEHAHRLRSAGQSSAHAEIRIVDAKGQPVTPGTVGEIAIRSGGVMQAYWNQPEQTANVLVDGWMLTGDGGYLDDEGFLFVVDRLKDMVVTGGENVYSAEVENVLAAHPDIAECAVIGVPDDQWGERVHAVLVARYGVELTADEVRDYVKAKIAGYKAPRSVEYIDALPRSSAGKVQKHLLRGSATTAP